MKRASVGAQLYHYLFYKSLMMISVYCCNLKGLGFNPIVIFTYFLKSFHEHINIKSL